MKIDSKNKEGFFSSLHKGLIKTSIKLSNGIKNIFSQGNKISKESLKEFEELLISMDIDHHNASLLTKKIAEIKFQEEKIEQLKIKEKLIDEIEKILIPVTNPIQITHKPHIIMLCGTNGNGKTTTAGKLAYKFHKMGKNVMLAACDTFRAAAVEQLQFWADNIKCHLVIGKEKSDPASVAYNAIERANTENIDILLIDTAGRLHNHKNLMDELVKINRIIKKKDESAPHDIILVLDATTGQNAYKQIDTFSKMANINGIIITKLDGTAKAGILIGIAQKYKINLRAIGIGEKAEDLKDFSAREFAKNILA